MLVACPSMARRCWNLNGKWKIVLDPYETGESGFVPIYENRKPKDRADRVEYSFDDAETLWVPGSWNFQKPELTYYEGRIWYKKSFELSEIAKHRRYFVRVGAANYHSTVTLNGEIIGTHEGGFTPFSFEITHQVRVGQNYLIIGVSSARSGDNLPGKVTDWFNHGGITRDVEILEVPRCFIARHSLQLDPASLGLPNRRISGKLRLDGVELPEKIKVTIPELGVEQEASVDEGGNAEFSLDVEGVLLWSPEHPKLYQVMLSAGDDTITDRIGFRSVVVDGQRILLNGNPVFLKGVSLHDENPLRKDRASTEDDARLVLGWARELGCNFLRLAHYPHQENVVKLADSLGFLIWEELPLYWGIAWDNESVLEKAKSQYTELIDRDRNRASVIIWSLANETVPSAARNAFLKALAEHVRSLDNTRLLSAACKKDQAGDGHPADLYTINDPILSLLDVIAFNEYLGWYGGEPAECRKKTFVAQIKKPIIVSEFGGDALQGFFADATTRWSEEYQEDLYRENLAMFDRIEGLVGLTPWILVDFMTPLRQLPHIQDGWNRKGLVSERGLKKKAFFELKRYYEGRAGRGAM